MLIAGELNVEVPNISLEDLNIFLQETEGLHNTIPGMSTEEFVYSHRNKKSYPWTRRVLEIKGKSFYNYRNKKPFINLLPIIDQLPIAPETRVILLLCQFKQPAYDFTWHFDKDSEYGFRVCLGVDTTQPFLEFGRMKDEYKDYAKDTEKSVMLGPNMVEEDRIHSITPSKPNTVICINGYRYAHRVPIVNAVNRVSIIVRGELTTTNFNLLQRIEDEFHS